MKKFRYKYSDGGRRKAGFSPKVSMSDCAVRAICNVMPYSYASIYESMNVYSQIMGKRTWAHAGVHLSVLRRFMREHGWRYVWLARQGWKKLGFERQNLPRGHVVAVLLIPGGAQWHVVAVKNGVVYDHDRKILNPEFLILGYWVRNKHRARRRRKR